MGYQGLRLSADEFLSIGEVPERYELIDGVVIMTPRPSPVHGRVLVQLVFQLESFVQQGRGATVYVETDVRFSPTGVYRPDIAVYREAPCTPTPARLDAPPALTIEVLSGATRGVDLITKRDDYERFGVGEYWTVDQSTAAVRCWARQGTRLVEKAMAGDLACEAIPGFVLRAAPLRRVVGR